VVVGEEMEVVVGGFPGFAGVDGDNVEVLGDCTGLGVDKCEVGLDQVLVLFGFDDFLEMG
jgi:hypothetical protein